MIVDVTLRTLKRLAKGGSSYLGYDSGDTYELYYVNQGPVVFRTIIIKDDNFFALMQSLGEHVIPLSSRIQDPQNQPLLDKLDELKDRLTNIELFIRANATRSR